MNVVMVIYFGMLMISNDCWDASNEMKWKKKAMKFIIIKRTKEQHLNWLLEGKKE